MCKEICNNLPLKLLTFVALAVVFLDVEVLKKTFQEYFQLKTFLDSETYDGCYKPQA